MYKAIRAFSKGMFTFKKGDDVPDEIGSNIPEGYVARLAVVSDAETKDEAPDGDASDEKDAKKTRKTKEVSDAETK